MRYPYTELIKTYLTLFNIQNLVKDMFIVGYGILVMLILGNLIILTS
nr:MAG TPA: hypothetical protein [Caudoviricetes sp.]